MSDTFAIPTTMTVTYDGLPATSAGQDGDSLPADQVAAARPPRDMLVRSMPPGPALELRSSTEGSVMTGHFAVFNQWARIDSVFEGTFMERIAPGAFTKTFTENRDKMRVLFQHGQDPQVGDKPMGPLTELRETDTGAYYEVPLLDTSYNHDIEPGLRAGLYGASFRFSVKKEDFDSKPRKAPHNPDALPERTIREAEVMEFGPVTFPAYAGASAGLRSDTDTFIQRLLVPEFDEIRELLQSLQPALQAREPAPEPLPRSSRVTAEPKHRFTNREEFLTWLTKI